MGTSGNRKGYKIFSINTTIRNPKRNVEFLKAFLPYNNKKISPNEMAGGYLYSLVKNGIYSFLNVSQSIKDKIRDDIPLTDAEVKQAFVDNPQATTFRGRALTQLRALRDQGFLIFKSETREYYEMEISKLGEELIKNEISSADIYCKSMIGMHANSPVRQKLFNESRPFLNTLFVIDGVNKKWLELGNEPKGILTHEFATFVLSMKDCDYKSAINNIIEYRKKYKLIANKKAITGFLDSQDILPLKYESIIKDYADDVFRKFEMTGLIIAHGGFKHIYYNFSQFNKSKVDIILEKYKNYKFETFSNQYDYYNYLHNIELPWAVNADTRKNIISAKSKLLKLNIDFNKTNLEQAEIIINDYFNKSIIARVVENLDEKSLLEELLILSGTIVSQSQYKDIPEALRLEYITAMLIAKKFGANGLIANMIMSENGEPLSYAPAGRPDIVFEHKDGSYIFELTMAKNSKQQENSETSNIVRHMAELKAVTGIEYRMALIAPLIHYDIATFFQFRCATSKEKIAPISIDKFVDDINKVETVAEYTNNFDSIVDMLLTMETKMYIDKINNKYKLI
ncbi:MAG: AlwI family type II restriction endonuclease [Bacteroidales bacterium]|nr:AlwI family type II restriction endonuclease [Bacteroidales bacterium]